ncbi:Ppx/GppA family phosphatase [Mesorhizobium sp. CA8]|uniref:Ppx/GppA phosphatase family protein n=1 Tax=unclassified Mesorhizobium TaxID=325217 RepID=UPI001CCDE6AA|nr:MULTISPECIES: Ppx/GppA phosphatase family protein [unclassified Mesorhizobium]MBZ9764883.1 Ppx/GppA family phosphatase [Mesorhizobium sp. CA8]MBZ9823407.1 Ppx/GppA family phosphatase [Mesorhizobium sp. CA4]
MEDHDTGAGASAVGMSGASPTQSAGPHTARFSRHAGAHQRHASQRQIGLSQADQHGDQPKGKTRKRRKRKRGRKVFARDENGAVPPAATAASQPRSGPSPVEPRLAAQQRPPQQELPVFAALDLGTNNCRLLVAVPGRHGQFRVIDAFSRIVRLGEGLTASGRLGQAAMDRAVEALKICGEKLRNRKIRKARLIATEACRSAANGVEFLDRVEREAGLKLEIIDRQTEARLAVSGCGSLVERDTQGVVLFDIGGGSSEIALIDLTGRRSPRLANHIVSWTSLPVGVVSLAERFGGRTVTRETFAAMVDDVAARLKAFDGRDRLAHVLASPNFHLLGTSGTVTTLAGVHLDLDRYDRRRVDGLWMDRDSVDRMIERLIGWDFQQRCANPCIGADRADLVLAGCAILEAIRGVWPSERLRVADRGLREGILSELMADDGVWRNNGGRRA